LRLVDGRGLDLKAEVAHSQTPDSSGLATAVEWTLALAGGLVQLSAGWMMIDPEFANPSSFALRGGTEELKVGYRFLMMKEIELTASKGYASYEIPELMNLITRGKLDISKLVTHRFPLGEVNRALEVLEGRIGDPIWVVLEP